MSENIKDIEQENQKEICDSLAIGSPTKGGAIKVYGNFDKIEEFKIKIDKAIEARQYANAKLSMIL